VSTNNRKNSHSGANHKLHLAVLAALPLMALASFNASAACTTVGTTVTCTGAIAGYLARTVPSLVDTLNLTDANPNAPTGSNSLVGLTVNVNSGASVTKNSAVQMWAINDNTGATTTPIYSIAAMINGATTLNNSGSITNLNGGKANNVSVQLGGDDAKLVNKAGGVINSTIDAPALSSVIGSSAAGVYGTSQTTLASGVYTTTTTFADGTPTVVNTATAGTAGSVSTLFTVNSAVMGVNTDVHGQFTVENRGTISANHAGVGKVWGVAASGKSDEMTVENYGTISATRTQAITLTTNSASSLKGTVTGGGGTQSLGVGAAVYSEEELALVDIHNHEGATISATGDLNAAIYQRANEVNIINDGTISYTQGLVGTLGGVAISSNEAPFGEVSADGTKFQLTMGKTTLENTETGVIAGDIQMVDANGLRWMASRIGGVNVAYDPTSISGPGRRDSVIDNSGTITGNIYLGAGNHELTNSGTLTGNVNVTQKVVYNYGAVNSLGNYPVGSTTLLPSQYSVAGDEEHQYDTLASFLAANPDKHFVFENSGTFTGNVTVTTATGATITNTVIELVPTVTGSGVGSTLTVPSTEIAGMGATLKIYDGATTSTANLATIAPKSLVTVHAGEYFKVADSLFGVSGGSTGASILPTVNNENTPLVNWNIATNAAGNLVVGVDSINSASSIAGVSARSGGAIDALMAGNSTLGGALQGLTVAADIEKAGQQLRPEANNASMQATMAAVDHVSSVIGTHQNETRTASNGNSGVSTGEAAQGVGFWMQGFGFKGDQSKRDGIDGYTANTGGFVLGGDTLVGNGDFRIGGAVGYAATGIDGDGATSAIRTDIDSYQGSLYGSYNAGAWYVDAALGYGRHQYDTKRYVALAGASVTGSHDANQYLVKIGAGYPMQMGKVTITPMATMTYVKLEQDGYTENDRSNSGAALTLASTQTDSFRSGLGAKISVPLSEGSMKTAVEARAIWNHEFADTNQDIAARFAGGTSFTTAGLNQASDSANLGLGLNLSTANRQNLSVNYDAEVKSDYVGHTASVKFRYDF